MKGGEFLVTVTDYKTVFIPEEWNEEQLMIRDTCQDFLDKEVFSQLDRIDTLEDGLMAKLVENAGALGLLGASVPEELGGMGLDFMTSMLTTEILGSGNSFAVAFSAHTGIGTLPILYYGTEEQRKKYVPKLASGEWKASYCLTEPDSGSDANAAKSTAKLSDDGKHYIINGQKMWITNAGFADVFIVFARIEDDKYLTAFIVEKGTEGISLNPEEKKLGIKGSSTRQVFFNNCTIPVENMLAGRGEGFKIAVNILNIGRIKLAIAAVGSSKKLSTISVKYANERNQFGRPISKYGAIRYKLSEQVTRIFACESALYRLSKDIENTILELEKTGLDSHEAKLKGAEEFAIEAAMMKVHGSEVLDYVVDEGLQIFGGMGYSAEAPMERSYRDARINRIFEGTNEINRLLTVDMTLRRAMKGKINLMGPAQDVVKELTSIPDFSDSYDEPLSYETSMVENFKKAILLVAGAAVKKFEFSLAKEQEVLMNIADMMIETYVSESTILRVKKLMDIKGAEHSAVYIDIARLYTNNACDIIDKKAREAANIIAEGDELRMLLLGIKRFTKQNQFNSKIARHHIAEKLIESNSYCY